MANLQQISHLLFGVTRTNHITFFHRKGVRSWQPCVRYNEAATVIKYIVRHRDAGDNLMLNDSNGVNMRNKRTGILSGTKLNRLGGEQI